MANRLDLHSELINILGSKNVYFQPPSSIKMSYPAIRYYINSIDVSTANDSLYLLNKSYTIILMHNDPDNTIVDKILKLQRCRFDRFYTMDNLNHYVFTLYY